jgi:hypothetical protein
MVQLSNRRERVMGSTSDSDEKLTKILMLKMRFRF